MLPHLILIILQLLGAVYGSRFLKGYIPSLPRTGYDLDIFIWAILFALLVFVIGFVGSVVLKGVRTPGTGTLSLALIMALIAGVLTLIKPITDAATSVGLGAETRQWWPLVGAMIGYIIKR